MRIAITDLFRSIYDKHVEPCFLRYWPRIQPHYVILKSIVVKAIIAFVIITFCLYGSAFLFGVIYYYNMPTIYQTYSLNFQYSRSCIQMHRNYVRRGDDSVHEIYTDSCYPAALVNLDSKAIDARQAYSVYLMLELPETETNLNMGMFMVTMKYGGKISSHSASMQHRSFSNKLLSSLFLWPIILFNMRKTTQIITIPLGDNILFYHPILEEIKQCLRMEHDGTHGKLIYHAKRSLVYDTNSKENLCSKRLALLQIDYPDIDIESASLHLTAQLSGLQYFLFQWPVFSFLSGTAVFFVPVFSSALVFLYITIRVQSSRNSMNVDHIEENASANDPPDCNAENNPPSPSCLPSIEGIINPLSNENDPPHSSSSSSIEMIGPSRNEDNQEELKNDEQSSVDSDFQGRESRPSNVRNRQKLHCD